VQAANLSDTLNGCSNADCVRPGRRLRYGVAPKGVPGFTKIATLFLSSQAANVNAWPDNGAQPQTRFASVRSERKHP
jgi:hypothetical protein